jgi:hypothetical protein
MTTSKKHNVQRMTTNMLFTKHYEQCMTANISSTKHFFFVLFYFSKTGLRITVYTWIKIFRKIIYGVFTRWLFPTRQNTFLRRWQRTSFKTTFSHRFKIASRFLISDCLQTTFKWLRHEILSEDDILGQFKNESWSATTTQLFSVKTTFSDNLKPKVDQRRQHNYF